jgi:predicted dehydrogenase
MKKLKVGLIGLGEVAEIHLEAYKEVTQIDVVAGAEPKKDRISYITEKWGIKGYTNYEEMLDKEKLDIVCVLTPPPLHREVTERVAEHKVHVLCEKPMALTLSDAKSMIDKCEKEDVMFCYGASYRYLCACRKAKEMIDKGKLGDVKLLMEFFIGGEGGKNWSELGPDHYPRGGPGGGGMGLIDHGIHLVDLFGWLSDSDVISVFGRGNYSEEVPHTEYLTMEFDNAAVGHLIYNEATYPTVLPYEGIYSWGGSWDIQGKLTLGGGWTEYPGNISVYGSEGSLRIFYYANKLFFFDGQTKKQIRVMDRPMPANFALQMESYAMRLQKGLAPEVMGSDGLRALQVILSAYESFETKRIVTLNSTI